MAFLHSTDRHPHVSYHPAPAQRGILAYVRSLIALQKSRRALARLTDRELADIGITRREALDEAQRPAWDVPRHWLR